MPEGVSIVLVDRSGPVLVRRAGPPFADMWSLPGGAVEPGEGAEAAARRELLEETGLTIGKLVEIGTHRVGPGPDAYRLTVFAAQHEGGAPVAGSDAAEAKVVPFERVPTLRLTPGLPGWIVKAVEALWDD